ncbi:hypothetical protein CH063_12373, partial [Colletotrichum higginsianum]
LSSANAGKPVLDLILHELIGGLESVNFGRRVPRSAVLGRVGWALTDIMTRGPGLQLRMSTGMFPRWNVHSRFR